MSPGHITETNNAVDKTKIATDDKQHYMTNWGGGKKKKN